MGFFDGYTAEQLIVMLVTAIVAISQGLWPGVSILEWLKAKLGLDGTKMQIVAIVFFMLLSALAMYVTGEIGEVEWTLQWLLANFSVFYGLAQIAYQMLKDRNGE